MPVFGILEPCRCERRTGEHLLETARRLLAWEALEEARGSQTEAAKLLGISKRHMQYLATDLQLRPIDK